MKSILLADDEDNLRILVHTTLEDPGYEILEAADGVEALRMAQESRPDLVLLDWMMPGMTGLEVARALRAEPETRSIPIILLTARSQQEDMALARQLSVDAYLLKPFSPAQLIDQVREVLGDSHP